jgi:hypothetical protein
MSGSVSDDRSHEKKSGSSKHGGQGHNSHDPGENSHGQAHSSHGHDKSAGDATEKRSRNDSDKKHGSSKPDDSAHRPQGYGQQQPRK